jgi:hypothetical protein
MLYLVLLLATLGTGLTAGVCVGIALGDVGPRRPSRSLSPRATDPRELALYDGGGW